MRQLKRWFPTPMLSAALFAMWLLLHQVPSVDNLLLAAVLALVIPRLVAPLRPAAGPMRRAMVLVRLVLVVGHDVVVSAVMVARGLLRRHPPPGSFVIVPLELRDPHALASLAVITAVVPGTVWCEAAPDGSAVRLHVFEVGEEEAFIEHYRLRYVQPLREIFE